MEPGELPENSNYTHSNFILFAPMSLYSYSGQTTNSEPFKLVLLWLEPPLANDFCNFLNKLAEIMKIFVEVDLLKSYQPLCQC